MNGLTYGLALATARTLGLERLDAQLLLLHALGKPCTDRAWLLAHDTDGLTAGEVQHFQALSQRRASGEPLAYLTGSTEFFGLQLQVDGRVLVPRPDTETLVEWALDRLARSSMPPVPQVLDLGTGSGAIALALKKNVPVLVMTAVDASDQALTVARQNAARHGLLIQFIKGNWFDKVGGHFHLIVSNPPYVVQADPHLAALRHEPLQALTAGADGLDDIRRIIEKAPAHLHPQGWLLLEHGYDQAARVCHLLRLRGFTEVQSRTDLAGVLRCSGGCWQGPANAAAQTAG